MEIFLDRVSSGRGRGDAYEAEDLVAGFGDKVVVFLIERIGQRTAAVYRMLTQFMGIDFVPKLVDLFPVVACRGCNRDGLSIHDWYSGMKCRFG